MISRPVASGGVAQFAALARRYQREPAPRSGSAEGTSGSLRNVRGISWRIVCDYESAAVHPGSVVGTKLCSTYRQPDGGIWRSLAYETPPLWR